MLNKDERERGIQTLGSTVWCRQLGFGWNGNHIGKLELYFEFQEQLKKEKKKKFTFKSYIKNYVFPLHFPVKKIHVPPFRICNNATRVEIRRELKI